MDQNMAFYDSIAPTKVVDLPEMATLREQVPIENFVHEEGMRELTSFHHTEAEFKHSSSKIASKPNFVSGQLTVISLGSPSCFPRRTITYSSLNAAPIFISYVCVCVCVCPSFRLLELQRRRLLHAPLPSLPPLLLLIYKSCAPAAA